LLTYWESSKVRKCRNLRRSSWRVPEASEGGGGFEEPTEHVAGYRPLPRVPLVSFFFRNLPPVDYALRFKFYALMIPSVVRDLFPPLSPHRVPFSISFLDHYLSFYVRSFLTTDTPSIIVADVGSFSPFSSFTHSRSFQTCLWFMIFFPILTSLFPMTA